MRYGAGAFLAHRLIIFCLKKEKCRAPAGRNDFFIRFPLKNQMLLGLCDWGVGASRVTLAIALALLRCTAVLLLLLFPKRGQGGSQGQLDL